MKTKKEIVFPIMPQDIDPVVKSYLVELQKVIHEINRGSYYDFINLIIPSKRAGGTRGAVAVKPETPSVGTAYLETDPGYYLGVCVGFDTYDQPIWKYAALEDIVP